MKYLFLDCDGVLNHLQSDHAGKLDPIEPFCMRQVNRIVKETGCEVIISSCWRSNGQEWVNKKFAENGATFVVADRTPELPERCRGDEIQMWLVMFAVVRKPFEVLEPFAILDDNTDMGALMPHLIHVDRRFGLTKADADKVIAMLNYDD